ncbi:hypothetical protein LCGC14_2319030, partial [marine sediment metagenome]
PRTLTIDDRQQAEEAAETIRFPCLLKPSLRGPVWDQHAKLKAYRASDPAELLMLYDRLSPLAERLIAQEWIEGPESNLFSCNCYLDADSKTLAPFVARKLRQWPPDVGMSSLGEECRNDVVLREAVQFFEAVHFHGLAYLEMKQDERTGEHLALEVNVGRPTGRSAIAEAGGVELLYAAYCDAVGLPLPTGLEQRYSGVKWIYLREDVRAALTRHRRGELGVREWWRSVRGPKAYAVLSFRDPAPFLSDLLRSAAKFVRAAAGRVGRRRSRQTPGEAG